MASDPAAADRAARELFSLARSLVPLYWPYLTSVVFRLVPRWTRAVPTMGVDQYCRLYLNPDYLVDEVKTPAALALLLAGHEAMHVTGAHAERLTEYRDAALVTTAGVEIDFANACHDLAINSGLADFDRSKTAYRRAQGLPAPAVPPPADGLYPDKVLDKKGKPLPVGLVSEGYAAILKGLPHAAKGGRTTYKMRCGPARAGGVCGGECGSAAGGRPRPWEDRTPAAAADPHSGVTPAERDVLARRVARDALDQAARNPGTVPAGLVVWAERAVRPGRIDWERELRREVRTAVNWAAGQADYTWARPNRRAVAAGSAVILPGFRRPDPEVVVVLDTSGSMGATDYATVFGEIVGIFRGLGLARVPVFCCDTETSEIQWVSRVEAIILRGGGGTDMGVAIAKAAREFRTRTAIVLTDGYTPWPETRPGKVRVVAALTRPPEAGNEPPDWIRSVVCADDRGDD